MKYQPILSIVICALISGIKCQLLGGGIGGGIGGLNLCGLDTCSDDECCMGSFLGGQECKTHGSEGDPCDECDCEDDLSCLNGVCTEYGTSTISTEGSSTGEWTTEGSSTGTDESTTEGSSTGTDESTTEGSSTGTDESTTEGSSTSTEGPNNDESTTPS